MRGLLHANAQAIGGLSDLRIGDRGFHASEIVRACRWRKKSPRSNDLGLWAADQRLGGGDAAPPQPKQPLIIRSVPEI